MKIDFFYFFFAMHKDLPLQMEAQAWRIRPCTEVTLMRRTQPELSNIKITLATLP